MAVLITGGAGGLGQACARRVADRGEALALVDIAENVSDVASEIAPDGRGVGVVADWTDEAQMADAWDLLESKIGPIDTVLNCAGAYTAKPVMEIDREFWEANLRLNLTAPFFVCQLAARRWIERGASGSIVNVASTAALRAGMYEATAYGAAKAGLVGVTVHLAQKLGPHNIRVNVVAPGSFHSPMTAQRLSDPAQVARSVERVPMGRMGQVDEVAGTIVHLALDDTFVNGVVVPIDGGLTITL